MAIFNGYVKLPEGNLIVLFFFPQKFSVPTIDSPNLSNLISPT